MNYKSRFEEMKEAPLWWNDRAQDLHASAGSLWLSMDKEYKSTFSRKLGLGQGYDLGVSNIHVFYMLFGLSFELLFKSILVLRNPKQKIPETHNLLLLAEHIDIILESNERSILDLLSEYIIWVAKYPIPKKEKEMDSYYDKYSTAAVDHIVGNNYTLEKYNGALEWEQIDMIWKKINELFFAEYSK